MSKLSEMVYSCNFCSAVFGACGNRSSHQHKFLSDEVGHPVYNCSPCLFSSWKLSALENHMRTCKSKFKNCCRSCFMRFNEAYLFMQQLNSLLTLPVFGPEYQPKEATAEKAFNGVLQTSKIFNNTADRESKIFILNQRSAITH